MKWKRRTLNWKRVEPGCDPELYAMTHHDCEIWSKLPVTIRGKGLTPGYNSDHFYQPGEQTHHLHRGCHRWDYDWNIIRVCRWVHEWIHASVDNENAARVLAIRDKIRTGSWNGDQAFELTGFDIIGQLSCWVVPARLEWVKPEWLALTQRHKARERR